MVNPAPAAAHSGRWPAAARHANRQAPVRPGARRSPALDPGRGQHAMMAIASKPDSRVATAAAASPAVAKVRPDPASTTVAMIRA